MNLIISFWNTDELNQCLYNRKTKTPPKPSLATNIHSHLFLFKNISSGHSSEAKIPFSLLLFLSHYLPLPSTTEMHLSLAFSSSRTSSSPHPSFTPARLTPQGHSALCISLCPVCRALSVSLPQAHIRAHHSQLVAASSSGRNAVSAVRHRYMPQSAGLCLTSVTTVPREQIHSLPQKTRKNRLKSQRNVIPVCTVSSRTAELTQIINET
jgi:hypothetical protein